MYELKLIDSCYLRRYNVYKYHFICAVQSQGGKPCNFLKPFFLFYIEKWILKIDESNFFFFGIEDNTLIIQEIPQKSINRIFRIIGQLSLKCKGDPPCHYTMTLKGRCSMKGKCNMRGAP